MSDFFVSNLCWEREREREVKGLRSPPPFCSRASEWPPKNRKNRFSSFSSLFESSVLSFALQPRRRCFEFFSPSHTTKRAKRRRVWGDGILPRTDVRTAHFATKRRKKRSARAHTAFPHNTLDNFPFFPPPKATPLPLPPPFNNDTFLCFANNTMGGGEERRRWKATDLSPWPGHPKWG